MKKQEPLRQRQKLNNETKISRLLNSIYYFLDYVFIIISETGYRLVILHHDQVIMDVHYHSLRGAKIAFAKYFGERAWAEEVQPQWSHTYQPDNAWISEKLEFLENYSRKRSGSSF
ncbi:MAG: hypothetical protein PVH61_17690 [Candidatus Aminicenantes bacterium]|jgi:hypothetical protein